MGTRALIRRSAIVLSLMATTAAYAEEYVIDDLGTLTNRSSDATGVTDTGFVVGWSSVSGDYNGEPWFNHAFRWQAGVMTDLGVLGPDAPPDVFPKPESMALGVNAAGQVVGKAAQPFEPYRGFLWLAEPAYGLPAGMNALPELPAGHTIANAINDAGDIVGESRPWGSIGPRPVLWHYDGTTWTITNLGTLGGPYGRAQGINNKGQIVGQANVPDGSLHSFLWLPTPDYGLTAGMHDLHPLSGSGNAFGINEQGQIVGYIGLGTPYLWLPAPAYGLPAGLNTIALPGIPNFAGAWPAAINERGVIVGQVAQQFYVDPPGIWVTHYSGLIWQSGAGQRLDDVLPPGSGWTTTNAADITNYGRIAGFGVPPEIPDQAHGFRLNPSTPQPGDLNCDGAVDFADINLFVLALADAPGYQQAYPECNLFNGDTNCDGAVDFADINPFVTCVVAGACDCP
jgi:probable HAF family extracellular repeat protein